jgi:hypothetical protein
MVVVSETRTIHTDTTRNLRHSTFLLKSQLLEHRILFMSICWREMERTIIFTFIIEGISIHTIRSMRLLSNVLVVTTRGSNGEPVAARILDRFPPFFEQTRASWQQNAEERLLFRGDEVDRRGGSQSRQWWHFLVS